MNRTTTLAMTLGILCASASAAFADSGTMTLTGAGNGVISNGVYVTPYTGTVSTPLYDYSGYVICDDYTTDSVVGNTWNVNLSSGANVAGSAAKFGGVSLFGYTLTQQQAYDAAGYLANELVAVTFTNPTQAQATAQTNTAFALWNLFDNNATGYSTTTEQNLEIAAIKAAEADASGHAYSSDITIATRAPPMPARNS